MTGYFAFGFLQPDTDPAFFASHSDPYCVFISMPFSTM